MNEGKIIVIVAPSGTGKSTLIKRLKQEVPAITESVSYTTRPCREGEVDGVHYSFISEDEFIEMRSRDEFLEWAEVHKKYYGTSKKFVENKYSEGKVLLFDLDVQGTDSFKDYFKDRAKAIFIAPPSLEVLEERLRGRATDAPEVIDVRLKNSKKEILRKDDYDYCVVNDDLNRAFDELKSVILNIINS